MDRAQLVRHLAAERLAGAAQGRQKPAVKAAALSLHEVQAMALPEAAAVVVIESIAMLRSKGASDAEAILRIEQHRSSLGKLPNAEQVSPMEYAALRMLLENRGKPGINSDACHRAAALACEAYGVEQGHSVYILTMELESLRKDASRWKDAYDACSDYYKGLASDEEFFGRLDRVFGLTDAQQYEAGVRICRPPPQD